MNNHAHAIRTALNVASAQNYVHVAVDAAVALDALLARLEDAERLLVTAHNRLLLDAMEARVDGPAVATARYIDSATLANEIFAFLELGRPE